MQINFQGQYVPPRHDHSYVSQCCTAPIMEGSEVYVWEVDTTAISGYCSACKDQAFLECLDCESTEEGEHMDNTGIDTDYQLPF